MDQLFAHDRAQTRGTAAPAVGGRARPESYERTFLYAGADHPTRVSSFLLARQRSTLAGRNAGVCVAAPNSRGKKPKAAFRNLSPKCREFEGFVRGLGGD